MKKLAIFLSLMFVVSTSLSLAQDIQTTKENQNSKFFIENKGQWDDRALFLSKMQNLNFWITPNGVVYDYYRIEKNEKKFNDDLTPNENYGSITKHYGHIVFSKFLNSNPNPIVEKNDIKETYHNYFIGDDQTKWKTNVPLFSNIVLKNIYQGIDVSYFYQEDNVRHDFIIAPNANPYQIKYKFEGQQKLSITGNGDLIVHTSLGEIVHTKLFAFQEIGNAKQPVDCKFVIEQDNIVRFELGNYDKNKTLIIDPVVRTFSSYLGSTSTDYAQSTTIDLSGFVYITGYTLSSAFPVTAGAYQTIISTTPDAFVTKMNATGSALVFSTFLGGNGDDRAVAIKVDANSTIYLAGYTTSTNYPVTTGAFRTTNSGGNDVFATRLSAAGNSLLQSTYIGGSSTELAYGMTIDNSGSMYITGYTASTNYPVSVGAFRTTNSGGNDVFLTKLNPGGQTLAYSTYIGGSSTDIAYGVEIDQFGAAYVTGYTASTNYPVTAGAYHTVYTATDPFLTKFNSTGTALIYSTLMPGNSTDIAWGIAVDNQQQATIVGYTFSTLNFPLVNAFRTTYLSGEAFMTKFNSSGNGLIFSTYFGGNSSDYFYDVVVDIEGLLYAAGYVSSTDITVTFDAAQPFSGGGTEGILVQVSPTGALRYSTYIGGSSTDQAYWYQCMDINQVNEVAVAGYTFSTNFPVSATAYQRVASSTPDGFIQQYAFDPPNKIFWGSVTPAPFCLGTTVAVNFTTFGTFKPNNQFIVELSDENGNFTSPRTIGTVTGQNPQTINCNIPVGLPPSSNYRMRIRSTSPAVTSNLSPLLTASPRPIAYRLLGTGTYCSYDLKGAEIRLESSENFYQYQLYRNNVAVGSPVIGTGGELSFGFFKGTGTYTIEAISPAGCRNWMSGQITIKEIQRPVVYNVTGGGPYYNQSGPGTYCEGGDGVAIGLSNSELGVKYQMLHNGVLIGVPIVGTGGELSFGFVTQPGTYTIFGETILGGCTSNMAGQIRVSILPAPREFPIDVQEGVCEGSLGNDVKILGSESGVSYQLLLNEKRIGNPVIGNGSSISLGRFKDLGKYQIIATNTSTGCTKVFAKSFELKAIPLPKKYEVKANKYFCEGSEGSEIKLMGSEKDVIYQLMQENTKIGNPIVGTGGEISFGYQNISGNYSIIGTSITGGCQNTMLNAVRIQAIPLPNSIIKGEEKPQIISKEKYWVEQTQEGDKYFWTVTNGTIEGDRNKAEILVSWSDKKSGKVEVWRENIYGCKSEGVLDISLSNNIIPDFLAEKTVGDAPFTVNFKNKSAGYITYYNWDFGNGYSSPLANPNHTYKVPGKYTVTLTIGYEDVRITKTMKDYITVNPAGSVKDEQPESNSLLSIFPLDPNPATSTLRLSYNSKSEQYVNIAIYDLMGNKVMEVFNGVLSNGINEMIIDVTKLPNGAYLLQAINKEGRLGKFFNISR